jgi:hypothetical protein
MVTLRTTSWIRKLSSTEMIDVAIHVKHDKTSSRASKMRRVLLSNMLSMGFNNRWRELFAGDIVTEERVWPRAMPTASGSIYSDHERLPSFIWLSKAELNVPSLLLT